VSWKGSGCWHARYHLGEDGDKRYCFYSLGAQTVGGIHKDAAHDDIREFVHDMRAFRLLVWHALANGTGNKPMMDNGLSRGESK